MTDTSKMRSEFEAWHADKYGWLPRHYDFYWNENYYEDEHFQNDWECWQASRQAVVVELKEPDPSTMSCNAMFGYQQARKADIEAIEAAGLRCEVQS